ncbi:MAG: D-alanyl-D-alanine carboxypeptidase family protein [Patescibacteria group bacterium]
MINYRFRLIALGTTSVVLAAALAFGVYKYVDLDRESDALVTANLEAHASIKDLEGRLNDAEAEKRRLEDALTQERAKTGAFERRIEEISGTVGTLAKLAETDPELLAKYSKVYFLNENYTPSALAPIKEEYLSDSSRDLEVHAKVRPRLEDLIEEAKENGIELRIVSAYRSFGTQAALKNGYAVTYGAGANRFSADQGYSEHQLGTTIDFTTAALGSGFTAFGTTDAFTWLKDNAHRYGFILSYPEGNRYYVSEPWHWRYVGEELARKLHAGNKYFYDLDQREINTYLASLFD